MKTPLHELLTEVFRKPHIQEAFRRHKESSNRFFEKWYKREWHYNKTRRDNFEDRYLE